MGKTSAMCPVYILLFTFRVSARFPLEYQKVANEALRSQLRTVYQCVAGIFRRRETNGAQGCPKRTRLC
jgi:hypothetical protein